MQISIKQYFAYVKRLEAPTQADGVTPKYELDGVKDASNSNQNWDGQTLSQNLNQIIEDAAFDFSYVFDCQISYSNLAAGGDSGWVEPTDALAAQLGI